MAKYPTPIGPGFYWAKLIHPSNMPNGEDWKSVNWEVVEVFENTLDETDPEYLGVFVGGVSPTQWIEDFVWGPFVQMPVELK